MTRPEPEHLEHDDALLDTTADRVAELGDAPLPALLDELRRIVPQVVATQRPDGTWPAPELLQEVLRSYLDLLDEHLRAEGVHEADLPDDRLWITALRECTGHPATLERLLDELHSEESTAGIPRYDPPAELRLIVEP